MVEWREGIRATPHFTAYCFEVWVDGVLWYWTNYRPSAQKFYEGLQKIFQHQE